MPKLTLAAESWPIAGTFTISRGSKTSAEVVTVTLEQDGRVGRGECVPYPRYNETVPQVLQALEAIRPAIEAGLHRHEVPGLLAPHAARNALDCALWDLEAKLSGKPVWQRALLGPPQSLTTAYTISLGEPEAMAEAARRAAHMPLLKLKLGRDGDEQRLRAVRATVPTTRLIIDANEGWQEASLQRLLALSADLGIEMVEQPLPAGHDEALRNIKHSVPICADESAHSADQIGELLGKYDAVNIKLDKTGGFTGALAFAQVAQANGLKIMLGCMVGTSLAMAPATLLGGMADLVDLDGPLLLARDREHGIAFSNGVMQPPSPELWG